MFPSSQVARKELATIKVKKRASTYKLTRCGTDSGIMWAKVRNLIDWTKASMLV